jgi:hypothetical protein
MKSIRYLSIIFLFCLDFTACQKDKMNGDFALLMQNLPSQKYFSSDVLNGKNQGIYGTWKWNGTSGGFAGMGYQKDFDYLVLKPNGIFGVLRNDSLISYGKLLVKIQAGNELFVEFVPDETPGLVSVEITSDREKYINFDKNNLNLDAPCCDRFNTHLKRVE